MTNKQIETAREIRLWLGQIVVPAAMAICTALTVPEVRQAVAAKANEVTNKIKFRANKK